MLPRIVEGTAVVTRVSDGASDKGGTLVRLSDGASDSRCASDGLISAIILPYCEHLLILIYLLYCVSSQSASCLFYSLISLPIFQFTINFLTVARNLD